jgi:penicillin-binding protein 1A
LTRTRTNNRRNKSPFYAEEPKREKKKKRRRSFFTGIGQLILLIMIGGASGLTGAGVQGYFYFTNNLPSVQALKNYTPPIVTQIFSDDGKLIQEIYKQKRYLVSFEEIPKKLQNAFIAAEDKNFWTHEGFDEEAIIRAVIANLKNFGGKRTPGASTITQQVAKNFFLTPERTITRKIKELILSMRIEKALTKRQILHLYLNQIYLGNRAYGVEAAARSYFGKHINDLTIAECAMLGGLAKGPSVYSPKKNMEAALQRRAYVLVRMRDEGYITQKQCKEARAEKPKLVNIENPYEWIAPDFWEHVRRYIEQKYGAKMLNEGGLKVYTTVDLDMTKMARKEVDKGLRELDKRQGYQGPLKTLNMKGVMEFLTKKTQSMEEPLRFGDITEGVVTHIDDKFIYVRLGNFIKGEIKREYVGRIPIDPNPKWWVRKPYVRPEKRTRNFTEGDLPFQVGDLILVRLVDPNEKRRELYLKKYGKTDPDMKNYKKYTEAMVQYFPLEVEQEPLAEAALMLRENKTGYVRVLIGGRKGDAKFNRATQAHRQPGSSFKPVIYTAALKNGYTCANLLFDTPIAIGNWRPKNFSGGYRGRMTLREALVKSQNIPAVKLLNLIGVQTAIEYARKLGYKSQIANNSSIALGSTGQGVSLEEQLNAYSVFPNQGFLVESVYITKLVDRNANILEQHTPSALHETQPESDQAQAQNVAHNVSDSSPFTETVKTGDSTMPRRAIDDATAYIMTDLLQDVVQNGTARILKKIVGRPDIAGKTGTTNDSEDAWFMGFSPDYTCGVWVGFDDHKPLGPGETGGKAAAPIWGHFMKEVLKDIPIRDFPSSEGVERRWIDPNTGLATAQGEGIEEIFRIGSAPKEPTPGLVKNNSFDSGSDSDVDQF